MPLPLVHELIPPPDPFDALRRFADLDGVLLFESASRRPRLGRYSFLTADPFFHHRVHRPHYGRDPFSSIWLGMTGEAETVPSLPPFQGGAAGLLCYELGGMWERLPPPHEESLPIPVLAVGIYDWVIAWDHEAARAWIVSQGLPQRAPDKRAARASGRLRRILKRLSEPVPPPDAAPSWTAPSTGPQFPLPGYPGVVSDFDRNGYLRAVERIINYIRAGDIFQANLSQRLSVRTDLSPIELYGRLRVVNPAPFAGYFASDHWAVVSASPERFLEVREGRVETRPIKGTRPRSPDPDADARLRADLLASEKDRAENVMIVDLLRNDLSRVCRPRTVTMPDLCVLETYETVHHLVSEVRGELETWRTVWDLLAAAFPGGSITGAPKVRAMEILRELEPTARGPYCGSLFYVGFDGSADSNILIRTMAVRGGEVRIGVGGGITAASDPAEEYQETLDKAAAMLRALDA